MVHIRQGHERIDFGSQGVKGQVHTRPDSFPGLVEASFSTSLDRVAFLVFNLYSVTFKQWIYVLLYKLHAGHNEF